MKTTKIDYVSPAIGSLFIGLMFASFSQSCSVTKANISKYISPVSLNTDALTVKPKIKLLSELSPNSVVYDSSGHNKAPYALNKDTVNYNKMILDNQELSLNNQKLSLMNENKIIELLMRKENENKKLKQDNNILVKKTEITQKEKEDAISMKAIWDLGNDILVLCSVILGLMILQAIAMVFYYRKQYFNRAK